MACHGDVVLQIFWLNESIYVLFISPLFSKMADSGVFCDSEW